MKKVLWNVATAALILTLSGCADTPPVQTENHPPQPTVEITLAPSAEPAGVVESVPVSFSAGNKLAVDAGPEETEASAEPTPSPEPEPAVKPSASSAPDTAQAPAPKGTPAPVVKKTPPSKQTTITFNVTTQKGDEETPSPAPSAAPVPEPTPTPPAQSEPPVEPAPTAFSIDHWIGYTQNYARSAGLNLDPTATACWDNPITAGAHCTCLERDIQSRLNRYARDESITDVWIWAEPRGDGSYDLYIGYA